VTGLIQSILRHKSEWTRLWIVAAILIASRVGASAKTYINTNYGFQVELPPGKVTCGPEYTTANHGFFVLWDTKDCLSSEDATGLYVEASYNALDLRSTFAEGSLICGGATITKPPFGSRVIDFINANPAVAKAPNHEILCLCQRA
jgi:hypothetical protein